LEDVKVGEIFRRSPDPDNPFSHQYRLLKNETKDVKRFGDLIHEHILLGNFGDDRLLALYQEEGNYLVAMFDLAKDHPDIFNQIFQKAFWSFILRIDITRGYKALERIIQAGLNMPRVPEPTGFGGLIQKMTGKKKTPEDVLMEQILYGNQGGLYT